ncbi:MAG: glucosidase [Sulfuriflexus sp.]|nr:glucosidase [Sulfuriflexus sp.]
MSQEKKRLQAIKDEQATWQRWGPYLSERSWGTVREDYSDDGDAWGYLSHDMARSKAYRWGEDGIGAISDRYQLLNFSLALWNGKDPILKERLFGLTPHEGNHGEDVKEYYFYLDSTPTHSYMKFLYKYPHAEYPYQELIDVNKSRGGQGEEYELLDTGAFDDDRYFDVFMEYAKQDAEDIAIRITVHNRGPEDAEIHLIPNLWFRNIWSWGDEALDAPIIKKGRKASKHVHLEADDSESTGLKNLPFEYKLGKRYLYADEDGTPMFTNNETNMARVYGEDADDGNKFVKDAFHGHVVNGEKCINTKNTGTKAGIHFTRTVKAGGTTVLKLRLTDSAMKDPLADVDKIVEARLKDADEFYADVHPPKANEDEKNIQRQAFAGLMWTKQNYIFDVQRWLAGDNGKMPPPDSRWGIRNQHWRHLNSMRILSMPDKWEYPWFAAWDLAFHTVPITLIDPEFAKDQLWLMLFEQFQHPNGQIPAYEWEFSDLNPPVHAWAVWRVYNMDRKRNGKPDREFLQKCFHKLLINFAWWINKVDSEGNNVFEGGFLGLDNITVFDRSEELPGGATLEQSDATGWMGMFCLNLMRIALELAKDNPVYEGLATKYFQHYIYVGAAMKQMGNRNYNLWDEEDGFFYDVLRYPDESFHKLRVRSLVGLIPLFAVERLEREKINSFNEFTSSFDWFVKNRQDVVQHVCNRIKTKDTDTHILTIVNEEQLKRILERMWDEGEFMSDYGLRSLSKHHEEHPFVLGDNMVGYEPGEAVCKLKGGNSNWRGPIWFPTSFLMIESLRKLDKAYGDLLKIKMEDGTEATAGDMAERLANGMINIFAKDKDGRRAVYGNNERFQTDPLWKDHILFYEYFHGDKGTGLGASHQTGWTALVASLIDEWRR